MNNFYVRDGLMTCQKLKSWWSDAGTFESLLKASSLVANKKLCACDTPVESKRGTTYAGASGEFGGDPIKHSQR